MNWFVYKLIPPRTTFPFDISETEAEIMGRHFVYWQALIDRGNVMVYGPVGDPAGTWGLAVVAADNEADVTALADRDPAVTSGMSRVEVYPMLDTVVRPEVADAVTRVRAPA